jgi:hypothetical protein
VSAPGIPALDQHLHHHIDDSVDATTMAPEPMGSFSFTAIFDGDTGRGAR